VVLPHESGKSAIKINESPKLPSHFNVNDESLALTTEAGIRLAAKRIEPFLRPTPLIRIEALSHQIEADVWLKVETVTPVASFKGRGAINHILVAREVGPVDMVVTSSTGNHGQGVAWAARKLGIRARIFLPVGANPVKKRMIDLLGAEIVETGADIDAAKDAARAKAETPGTIFVDDGESLPRRRGGSLANVSSRCVARFLVGPGGPRIRYRPEV
jgi:threonine dehydratase